MGQPIDSVTVEVVPDFSGFARELRTGIDAALRQLTSQVNAAFASVERGATQAGHDIGTEFQRGGERAEGALREVSTQAKVSMAQVAASSEAAAGAVSGKLTGALAIAKTALLGFGLAAAAGLGAATVFGLKSAASLEQTTVGLEALTGSAETAKKFLVELQQFAATTPFEFQGVADASRRILAFGTSVGIAREQVIPTLTTIGDLVSVLGGTQESVDSVVRALGQMASKGKLSQEEILQLAEALPGFNANAAIAAKVGMSVPDTLAAITAGSIDAKTGINALLEGMAEFPGAAGAMVKQSQTLLGVFSTFKDTLAISLTNAFQPVIPAIKDSLAELTPVLGAALDKLAPALGGLLSSLLPLIGGLVTGLVPILSPILDFISTIAGGLNGVLGPLGTAIGGILSAFAPLAPVISSLVSTLGTALVPILTTLMPVFTAVAGVVTQALSSIIPIINRLAPLFTSVLGTSLELIAELITLLGPPVIALVQALAELLMPILEALAPVIVDLVHSLMPMIPSLVALVLPVTKLVIALLPLVDLIVALLPAILAILGPLLKFQAWASTLVTNTLLVPFITELSGAVTNLLAPVEAVAGGVEKLGAGLDAINWGAIGAAIGGAFADAWQAVRDFFSDIGQKFTEWPGKIRDAVSGAGTWLINAGKSIVTGLWEGISSLGGWLWQKVKDFAYDNTVGAIKNGLGISSPSTVAADQVGRWIPAGIEQGIQSGMSSLSALMSSIGMGGSGAPQSATPTAVGAPPIMVNLNFAGAVPTEAEAYRAGQAAGQGVASALSRRNVALAGRVA